jgi:FdhD protein
MGNNGIHEIEYILYSGGKGTVIEDAVIKEQLICIFVNGKELATFMCSPENPQELALGFLRSEGFIESLEDVDLITTSRHQTCVDVWLKGNKPFKAPKRRIITSGCGGGVTFDDLSRKVTPLNSEVVFQPDQIFSMMRQLHQAATLYKQVRGVHTSALSDGQQLLVVAEDVGRHNTIDRLWGQAMQQEIETKNRLIITTGRVSSEMLNKAAKMGVPVVASRTSPTSLSVELAQAWNITLLGYVRPPRMRVYTAWHRIDDQAQRESSSALIGAGALAT